MKKIVTATGIGVALAAVLVQLGLTEGLFSSRYLPHQFCYLAQPRLIWTNVTADSLIAVSYAAIFASLLWMAWRLRGIGDLREYLWIFVSFALFIVACGITHVMEVVTVWWPVYPLSAALKVVCAGASVPTAILFTRAAPALSRRIPQVVELLSRTEHERDEALASLLAAEAMMAARAEVQAELDAANTQLNHILDSTHDGIIKVDRSWRITYSNLKATELLPDLQLRRSFWSCFPDLIGSHAEGALRSAMEEQVATQYEIFYEPYQEWYRVHVYPTPGGISLFFIVVTEQKKLERQLEEARRAREERIEALGHMAAGIAHEINNPLAIIHGTASDLVDQSRAHASAGEETQQAGQLIVRMSERIVRILKGLRGFARDASRDPMEPASIETMIDDAVQMQGMRLAKHGIALERSIPPGLPPLVCRETQIVQILTNLINNALDAIVEQNCAERWIRIEASVADGRMQIDVSDSGNELTAAVRERLMEPFFTTKTRGLGMGVGLSLSRAIAREHGGNLILCDPPLPTRFRLTLPLKGTETQQEAT